MPNIKLSYLYRDSANYKTHGYVVFTNPKEISLKEAESYVSSKLIDGEYFYANQWQVPDLFPATFNPSDDPTWHELESVELTNEPATFPHRPIRSP
ncbi:hypothetical protein [Mucilaginibacter antarcticus]|uniref:Uncharacterized protein n=1 Tax=Mucilaginibacter antarcticus TaxID=1855725 RepID=A0ABW5XKQ8_9SPHI